MRKPNTKHHARYHRDRAIAKWERQVRNCTKDWGVCGQYVSPYSGEVSSYNFPERYDWELKGEHNRYNKTSCIWIGYTWYAPHKSHHIFKYGDLRSYLNRYMDKYDIAGVFTVKYPYDD